MYTDSWLAYKDRYDEFSGDEQYASIYGKLAASVLFSIEKCWRKACFFPYKEVMKHKEEYYEMSGFVRSHFKYLRSFSGMKKAVLTAACLPFISLRLVHILSLVNPHGTS